MEVDSRGRLVRVDAGLEGQELRRVIYDQESTFGDGGGTGRLVLVSCGGAFDNSTGNYEDNVFLFAMPVG